MASNPDGTHPGLPEGHSTNKTGKDSMNVYINNLPLGVDSGILRLMMMAYGELESCSVVKNHLTGESKGYGFVQFISSQSAHEAIAKLNNCTAHGGRPLNCRIAIPLSARQTSVNLYVRNLPRNFEPQRLYDIFAPFGEISSHKVINDSVGQKLGIGFVRYTSLEAAEGAIKGLSGSKPEDDFVQPLLVELADKNNQTIIDQANPSFRPSRPKPQDPKSAFAGGVVSGSEYLQAYATTGVPVIPQSVVPGGQMPAVTQVTVPAIHSASHQVVMPQVPTEAAAQSASPPEDASNVYINGFPLNWGDNELTSKFRDYGEIVSVRILRGQSGDSRGIGFVRYRTVEAAHSAISALNGTVVDGRTLTCRIASCASRRGGGGYGKLRQRLYTAGVQDSPYTMGPRKSGSQQVQYVYPGGQHVVQTTDSAGRMILQSPSRASSLRQPLGSDATPGAVMQPQYPQPGAQSGYPPQQYVTEGYTQQYPQY